MSFVYGNGVDGETGYYLAPPMELKAATSIARKNPPDPRLAQFLKGMQRQVQEPSLCLPPGVDPADATQAGWGIVFHRREDPAVRKALEPLIEHRRRLIGDERTHVLECHDDETPTKWLARHGVSRGTIKREKVPYYLVLVGDPDLIPFDFGHNLTVEYAVGRLSFETGAEYARYAESVVDYETGAGVPNSREAVFWAPCHGPDDATRLSEGKLVRPLIDRASHEGPGTSGSGTGDRRRFSIRRFLKADARKQALADTLHPDGREKLPALLFTASHGVGFRRGHDRQSACQGALLGQDWPKLGTIGPAHFFAAEDVSPEARVHGLIAFFFACYSAGTPKWDRFPYAERAPEPREAERAPALAELAPRPFIAALPRRLLAHEGGGALACIGHVERAWSYSIASHDVGPQIGHFEHTIDGILAGQPVGFAMRSFFMRFAALSTTLSSILERERARESVSDEELAAAWIERNDAEAYLLLGDPAVRLRTDVM